MNAAYIGSRLGICWEVLGEKHVEFQSSHVRDPYPLIAEKAGLEKGTMVSKLLRTIAVGKKSAASHIKHYLFINLDELCG